MTQKNMLLEIGTEELPASYIEPAAKQLGSLFEEAVKQRGLKYESVSYYCTPRRLALYVEKLDDKSEDRVEEMLGPSVKAGKSADGNFTQASIGFASKHAVSPDKLTIKTTDKGEYFCAVKKIPGEKTEKLLSSIFPEILKKLYFPKTMVWNASLFGFARPMRTIIAIYGEKVVKFTVAGIKSSNYTVGLHATSAKKIIVTAPEKYITALRNNCVIANQSERREILCKVVESAAKRVKGAVIKDEALIDEINFLVEHPVAVLGKFDEKFLNLPKEVLVTCLRKKQKFFAIEDHNNKLTNYFVGIRNGISEHQEVVREGYERVLVARLMDAEFFFAKDTKTTLASKAEKLKSVMFQEALGTVYDKALRMEQLAVYAANSLENKAELFAGMPEIEKAAKLSKADLVTDMVYEYPELQGVIGRIYAAHDGEPKTMADSVEEHYMPVTVDGALPCCRLGILLSIADKTDTLVGDFAAGLIPSGSADPYGLRRMATGILRLIVEKKLPLTLKGLVDKAFSLLPEKVRSNSKAPAQVMDFLRLRLENLWEAEGYKFDEVRAVLATGYDNVLDAGERLKALKKMRAQKDFESLAAAFKRASNILKQASKNKITVPESVNESLLAEEAEKALYLEVKKLEAAVTGFTEKKEYVEALTEIVSLKPSVDAFFEKVMVMAEDEALRANRLALLSYTAKLFSNILDFSQLQN